MNRKEIAALRARLRGGIIPSDPLLLIQRKLKMHRQPHSTMGVVLPAGRCRAIVARNGLHLERMAGAHNQYTRLTVRKRA